MPFLYLNVQSATFLRLFWTSINLLSAPMSNLPLSRSRFGLSLTFNRPEIQFFTFPQLFWTSSSLSSTSASNQQNLPHQLHKQHITYRSACDRNKHLPFPFVKKNCHNNCNQLWQTITAACHINIFKAVHIAYMR